MEYSIPMEIMGQVDQNCLGGQQEYVESMISSVSCAVPLTSSSNKLPDPIDYLKKIMSERGLRNKDMKVYIGSSGNVCSVMKRHKPLSLRMIRNLNTYLHIPAEILIQPYDCH